MNSIIFSVLLTSAIPLFEAKTLDDRTLTGSLEELTADRLTIVTGAGRVSLETDKLLRLSPRRKPKSAPCAAGVVVELADGSIIQGLQYVARDGRARITLVGGRIVEAPTNVVQAVRFRGTNETRFQQEQQESDKLGSEWSRLVDKKVDGDLLVVRTDDALDYHQGVLHDVTEEAVHFGLDGEILPVKRAKVFGIVYRHGIQAELPATVCRITDSAGSLWSVRSLALSEKLQWTTPTGLSVWQPLENVAQIDFSAGKLIYLSDLKPDSVVWTPYFGVEKLLPAIRQFYAPRFDRGFDGGPLQLDGTLYSKGLALHARTELVYQLPGQFSRFRVVAGIDDAGRPGGKVRLVVRGDDKVLLEATVADGDAPQTIDLDLTGARRLTILVDFGDSLGSGDRLLLCNVRIMK